MTPNEYTVRDDPEADLGNVLGHDPKAGTYTRRRTRSEVEYQRQFGKGGSGCCERYANMQGCDCLSEAAHCDLCDDTGFVGNPHNGKNPKAYRCPRRCHVRCAVCRNPNCDNPNGQH